MVCAQGEAHNRTMLLQPHHLLLLLLPPLPDPNVYLVNYTDKDKDTMMISEVGSYVVEHSAVPLPVRRQLNQLGAAPALPLQPPKEPEQQPPPAPMCAAHGKRPRDKPLVYADIRSFLTQPSAHQTENMPPGPATHHHADRKKETRQSTMEPNSKKGASKQSNKTAQNNPSMGGVPQVMTHVHATTPLHIATWNARGLYSSKEDLHHMLSHLEATQGEVPHIIVLTEVKQRRMHNWIHQHMRHYHIFGSFAHSPTDTQHKKARGSNKKRAKAGVIIALRKDWLMLGTSFAASLPSTLGGYVAQVHIQLPDSAPLTVIGMYCPHNLQKRHNIYSILVDMHTTTTDPMVVAGDFNATTFDSDRRSHKRTSADSAHREFMQQHNLRPIDGPAGAAARTYTKSI